MTCLAIETRNLSQHFGRFVAVDSVSLSVPQRTVYGFLGRNGAGKTTTLKMILALIRPSSGDVKICGRDVFTSRIATAAMTGSLLEAHGFYRNLTGRENLDLSRRLLGLPRSAIDLALDITSMTSDAKRRVGGYSLGMRQRLGIARALLGAPRVLILDEPANGLDPDGISDMRLFLRNLPERTGATVLMSSHLLSEVEVTAAHVGILHRGRLVAEGPLEQLKAELPVRLNLDVSEPERALALAQSRGFSVALADDIVVVNLDSVDDEREAAGALNRALVEAGIDVCTVQAEARSLEAFYRRVTGVSAMAEIAGAA